MPSYLHLIDDTTGGPRADVTPLFADPAAFAALVRDLAARFDSAQVDLVAGIDALGFILGAGLALRLGRGFLALRKEGKLPGPAQRVQFVDYTGHSKALEVRVGAIPAGARVLIVDEWIETGAQVRAAIALIEGQGGRVAGVATIHLDRGPLTEPLLARYNCQAIRME
jgi:adenine phosphoribosyltransferase